MADNKQKVRQHEPLRVPQGWTDQARSLVMQIERVFDKVFSLFSGKADKAKGATAGNFAAFDDEGNLVDSEKKAGDFKTKQTAKSDPTASGNTLAFIDTLSQNTNGVITATKKNVSVANNLTTTSSGSVLDARQGKELNDAKANISGQVFTGNISVQKASGATEVYAKRTDSGLTVEILIGSAGVNHGLYSNGYVDSNNTFHSGASWMVNRNSSGNVMVDFPYFSISPNSNRTFTIGNSFRGTFYLIGTNSSNQAIYNVYSTSEGSVASGKFGTSSAFTITTGTGTIKIANGSAYTTHVYVMVFNGSVS